jgi:hypothetical protein
LATGEIIMPKVEKKPAAKKKGKVRTKARAKVAEKRSPGERVRVRNVMQRRPVLLHFPGGIQVRLGPGETAEISGTHTRSRECLRFCRDGLLHVESASGNAPAAAEKAAAPRSVPAADGSAGSEAAQAQAAADTKRDDASSQPDFGQKGRKE